MHFVANIITKIVAEMTVKIKFASNWTRCFKIVCGFFSC